MTYCSADVGPDVIVPMVTHRRASNQARGGGGGGGGIGAAFHCHRARLNGLWSLWYCVGVVAFHVYLTVASIQRFAAYIALPWPEQAQPYFELNAYVGFVGAAVVLAPFFVVSAILKVGNLANDGHQLGSAADVHVLDPAPHQPLGLIRTVWLHSGPTAPLLHLIAAFCLLLPKVLMQAQLIRHGFLPKGELWRTDLDFMLTYKDRIVVWSFLASNNLTTPLALTSNADNSIPREEHARDRLHDNALISPEFVNYALALLVYAVRYPAVFWATNKPLSLLFSTQLVLNALQSLLAFTGFAVLYKLRCFGPQAVLPPGEPFLMGVGVALALYVAYAMAVTACGSVVYLYAFQKYKAYVAREREKHHISWRAGSNTLWGYLPHCIALAILMALASTSTPLTYDAMLVYRGNLDGAILACVIGTVMHLFLWIVLWLFLTLKNHWRFRVDPGDGRLARQLGNLEMSRLSSGSSGTPLVVLSEGQTFAVHEASPRAAIMNIVEKATGSSSGSSHRSSRAAVDHNNDDDDIYWLKPKPTVPKETADTRQPSWLARRKSSSSTASKPKVLFEDSLRGGSPRRVRAACTKSPKIGKVKKQNVKFEDLTDSEDDDGDYATLRDLPLVREEEEPEDGKELHNKAGEMDADSDADETQTLLLGRRDPHMITRISPAAQQATTRASVTVHPTKGDISAPTLPTPQSVSSSPSPPGKCSDTSSGVHSSSSMSDNHSRRSSSVDEMTTVGLHPRLVPQPPQVPAPAWRSLSLQRTGMPPAPQQILARRGSATLDRSPVSDTAADDPDATLVIRRKAGRLKSGETGRLEPFGRATNMRMTSFTDQPDFPEQRVAAWQKMGLSSTVPGHRGPVPWQLQQQQQRDSANYSLTSSGDSDSYLSHQ